MIFSISNLLGKETSAVHLPFEATLFYFPIFCSYFHRRRQHLLPLEGPSLIGLNSMGHKCSEVPTISTECTCRTSFPLEEPCIRTFSSWVDRGGPYMASYRFKGTRTTYHTREAIRVASKSY
jgi:hypothetical protein